MKNSKKLTVFALCLIAAAVLVTTSCDGFGKDDFYGTWTSTYTYPTSEADFNTTFGDAAWKKDESTGTVTTTSKYDSAYAGQQFIVTMYFEGKSEDLLKTDGASFWQEKFRYTKAGKLAAHTFYKGTYKLDNNSNVTSGDLVLSYRYGYKFASTDTVTVDTLNTLDFEDSAAVKAANLKGTVCDLYDADKKQCADVETFAFSLGDSDFFKGYQSMSATEESYYNEQTAAYVSKYSCSWDVPTRSFTLKSEDSDLTTNKDTGSDWDASVIALPTAADAIPEK